MTLPITLTRAQKAAAILVAMGKPAASRLLKFFKQEELKALIEAARLLKTIPQSELERIVAEFEAEFAEGAGLLDSADTMDKLMNESLSPEEMSAIMGENKTAVVVKGPSPVWTELEKLDPSRLGAFLTAEHPQMAALVLSKLAPAAASAVLLVLEKPLRVDIVRRMMSLAAIPDTATKIAEKQLQDRLLSDRSAKDMSAGQSRVASLLNEMEKSQLEEVMQDLEESGTPELEGVRARLFAFEDIVHLSQKARVVLFDGLSTELVTLCLRGAGPELMEAVLSSIGARSRRMIESELVQGGENVAASDVAAARRTVASTAIRMSLEGELDLPTIRDAA